MKVKRKATLDGKEVEVEIEVEDPKTRTVKRKATLDGKEVEVEMEIEDPKTARTVSEMDPDELTKGLGKALAEAVAVTTGEAIERTLAGLGVGTVNREEIVVINDDAQRGAKKDDDVRTHYGEALRAVSPSLEFHPDVRCLKTQEEREQKIMDALMIQDYFRSQVTHDLQRCENISRISWGQSWERQLLTGTTAAALIPKPLFAPIIEKRELADKITPRATQHRSEATTADVSVENVLMNAQAKAEGADVFAGATNISFTALQLTKRKSVGTAISSRETMFDHLQAMQLVANLSSQAGRALGNFNNEENMNGDGTGIRYTDGILNAAPAIATSGGSLTRDKIMLLINGISSEFWDTGNMWWMMDQATLSVFSSLTDLNEQPLYPTLNLVQAQVVSGDAPGIGWGSVENIPVLLLPVATMLGVVAIGNLDFFAALVEDSIRVETTTDGGDAFELDTQKWKFVQRQDGLVSLATAFAKGDAATIA